MLSSLTLSQWGLIIDLIGVLLLFEYGLPSKIKDEEGEGLSIGADEQEVENIRRHNIKIKRGAYAGLACILAGFLLQFIGSFHH